VNSTNSIELHHMQTFIVGGAVRDRLLGLAVKDRDFVVVGATPEQMLKAGFKPVGKIPVFLHPKTKEEYALARTERKTAAGYKGFVFHTDPSVTLEQDLIRRDLTINAIAQDEDGQLIDPYHGQRDLQDRVFRHVSSAFEEDPVRILRLARFAARFSMPGQEFSVAPETMTLMQNMVIKGEVDALVAERVWQEIARGLMEARPSRMFAILRETGALARLLPELLSATDAMHLVDAAASAEHSLAIRLATLLQSLNVHARDKQAAITIVEQICHRLRIPNDCRDLAILCTREYGKLEESPTFDAEQLLSLFERCDAFRKSERFLDFLKVAEINIRASRNLPSSSIPESTF